MYPWQSGSDGREETQQLHLNPRSGRWLPDHSRLQHHVGSAIAYNVWQYCEATGDTEFLHTKGAEMLLQIARFWADTADFDPEPRAATASAAWSAPTSTTTATRTPPARAWTTTRTPTSPPPGSSPAPWTSCGAFPHGAGRNCSSASGWTAANSRVGGDLPAVAGAVPPGRHQPVRRLRRPRRAGLGRLPRSATTASGGWTGSSRPRATPSTATKPPSRPTSSCSATSSRPPSSRLFRRLGYDLDDEIWRRTVDYYLQRTSHGSTLSGLVHAWVLARVRRAEAWKYCQEALEEDVADLQGGTTGEGIHLGAMAGTLDLVQRGLTGLETREDALWLDPVPLPALSEYGFSLRYRGHGASAYGCAADSCGSGCPTRRCHRSTSSSPTVRSR